MEYIRALTQGTTRRQRADERGDGERGWWRGGRREEGGGSDRVLSFKVHTVEALGHESGQRTAHSKLKQFRLKNSVPQKVSKRVGTCGVSFEETIKSSRYRISWHVETIPAKQRC